MGHFLSNFVSRWVNAAAMAQEGHDDGGQTCHQVSHEDQHACCEGKGDPEWVGEEGDPEVSCGGGGSDDPMNPLLEVCPQKRPTRILGKLFTELSK